MIITCWSAKGGVGTTVIAASLALSLAERHPAGVLAVDLAGDLPAVLGLADEPGAGIGDWLAAGDEVGDDAWQHLEQAPQGDLHLLPTGTACTQSRHEERRAAHLVDALALDPRTVVVDAGLVRGTTGAAAVLVRKATLSLLVTRGCYVALRHGVAAPHRPTGVVLVAEAGRALDVDDVEQVIGAPVVARVGWEPAVARAVDAGLLATRLPRRLERAVRSAA